MDAQMLGILAAGTALVALLAYFKKGPAMLRGRNRDKALWGGAIATILLLMWGGIATWEAWADDLGFDEPEDLSPGIEFIGDDNAPAVCSTPCPTTGLTGMTVDVQNSENDATLEEFDVGMKCIGEDGSAISITDTTNPTASNFNCGVEYTCYIASTSGAAGDGSVVDSVLSGVASIVNGNLKFTACGAGGAIQAEVAQHGVPEVRVYDMDNAAWAYATATATAVEWVNTDGIVYVGTTDNSTEVAVGAGGEINRKLYFRSTVADQSLNDRGIIFLVDAAATTWDDPVVMLDGVTLTDNCDGLNSDESTAYSAYEHCYIYTGDKDFTNTETGVLEISMNALSGVNPATGGSDDVKVEIAMRGQYVSTLNGNEYKVGAVQDNAAHTTVHTLHTVTLVDVS